MKVIAELLEIAGQGGYPCLFHIITGAYCPGCGGTRAAAALLQGQVMESIWYHPLVPYAAIAAPLLLLYLLYCRKKKRRMPPPVWKTVLFVGIFLLILNFSVKNYLLFVRHVDLLAMLDGV